MRRQFAIRIGLSLLAIQMLIGCSQRAVSPSEAAAVAAIVKLGGKVESDETLPEHPVIKVYLHGTPVTDQDLAILKDLKQLKNLFLGRTKISDAGLDELKSLPQLQTLSLNSTEITNAGLRHLANLTALQTLNLQETKVTRDAVRELQKSLPNTRIAH